jgi:serine/threonine protein phosphatase PrpC
VTLHRVGHRSDIGRVRRVNEDHHRVWHLAAPDGALLACAVADGMGGAAAGEVASALAISVLDDAFHRHLQQRRSALPVVGSDELLAGGFRIANRRVYQAAASDDRRGMGTTLTCLLLDGDAGWIAHVGDSRAYRLRGRRLEQLTRDHTWVAEQVALGNLTSCEAQQHEWRHLITRAVGTQADVDVDLLPIDVRAGDLFLLCSDGLHGVVPADALTDLLTRAPSPQRGVDALIDLSLDLGAPDNVTAIAIEVRG